MSPLPVFREFPLDREVVLIMLGMSVAYPAVKPDWIPLLGFLFCLSVFVHSVRIIRYIFRRFGEG